MALRTEHASVPYRQLAVRAPMKLLPVTMILLLTACVSLNKSNPVFIGELEWVKLRPNEPLQSRVLENGLEEIVISNSCGTAEIKYQVAGSRDRLVWMSMGEWCRTPFDIEFDLHLVIVSQEEMILEYYAIEEDEKKNRVVFLLDSKGTGYDHLSHLLSDLSSPVFLEELDESNSTWAESLSAEGIVIVKNGDIYIIRAVYIADVITEYQL